MQFLKFKQQFSSYIVFSTKEIEKMYPAFNRMNLLAWQKKGYLQKIRNGLYCFSDIKLNETVLFYIANKIYKPSYVSLESAFLYYNLIPEAVFSISSITTLKTQKFNTNLSFNTYSNIKTSCFFGYRLVQNENYTFKIAELEKSLLDYLYLRKSVKTLTDIESLRLNKQLLQEKLDLKIFSNYARIFNSKVLFKKVKMFNQFLND